MKSVWILLCCAVLAAALTACKDAHISELGITVQIAGKGLRRK